MSAPTSPGREEVCPFALPVRVEQERYADYGGDCLFAVLSANEPPMFIGRYVLRETADFIARAINASGGATP